MTTILFAELAPRGGVRQSALPSVGEVGTKGPETGRRAGRSPPDQIFSESTRHRRVCCRPYPAQCREDAAARARALACACIRKHKDRPSPIRTTLDVAVTSVYYG